MKKDIRIITALVALLGLTASCEKDQGLQESELIYFSVTQPYTRIGGISCTVDNINHVVTNNEPIPGSVDLTRATPFFVTNHEGEGVFVNGVRQESGQTVQDLSSPKEYEVRSERGTVKYTVNLTKSESLQTQAAVKLSLISGLVDEVIEESEEWMNEALRFSRVVFCTPDSRVLSLNLFEADLSESKVGLYALTPDNTSVAPHSGQAWPTQDLPGMAAAAEGAGFKVFGAINAGSFDASSDNAPLGPLRKGGQWMKTSFFSESGTNYVALRSDGKISLGGYSDFTALMDKLDEVVGADSWLVKDNAPDGALASDASRISRSGIGTNGEDHKTLLLASLRGESGVGCSKSELASVLMSFGSAHALEFQGGDAAAIVKKGNGAFTPVGASSEALPQLPCALAIIGK